ncbi:hypothetical protein V5F59_07485 [Xanthobacter autotrophicus DSM 431]|uniref:hypothetical protein n=1 Tax=Xanthobacter nonsaccharivorans TaxID=3119912 RepID=UPI0037271842
MTRHPPQDRAGIGPLGSRTAALSLSFLVGACTDEPLKTVYFCEDRSDYKIYRTATLHNGFPAFNSFISESIMIDHKENTFRILEINDTPDGDISITCKDDNIDIELDAGLEERMIKRLAAPEDIKIAISIKRPPASPSFFFRP